MSDDLRVNFTIKPLACALALLATAAIAFFLAGRFERQLPAILIAGLTVPLMMLLAMLYAMLTDDEWPMPGAVLFRVLALIGVTAVVTLAISGLMVRLARL